MPGGPPRSRLDDSRSLFIAMLSSYMKAPSALIHLGLAATISVTFFVGAPAQSDESQPTLLHILSVAQSEVARLQSSREVYKWEYEGPHLRTPHYCFEECACLATKISTAIWRDRPDTKMRIVKLTPTNALGIKMISLKRDYSQFFDYHEAIEVLSDGRKLVIDPILTGRPITALMDENIWLTHFSNFVFGYED